MNQNFQLFLRQFILVFFDNIFIFSTNWQDHLKHVRQTLNVIRDNQLFTKKSKCEFRVEKVKYMAHIISGNGVKLDRDKVQAVFDERDFRIGMTVSKIC